MTVVALAIVLGAAVIAVIRRGGWVDPNDARYPIRGVDVSHHQGEIDWSRVAQERIAFSYVKATEGADLTDSRFAENWRAARASGLRVGAYHFFSLCRPAREQAARFLATVPRDDHALPPALDVELGGNCASIPPVEDVRRALHAWLDIVARASGARPIVYVTREAYDLFLRDAGFGEPIWIRDLWREPEQPFVLWQFRARGRVAGIRGPVDLDTFAGGREAFAHW
jgi:lysozyme